MNRLTTVKTRLVIPVLLAIGMLMPLASCNDDDETKDTWSYYEDWRNANEEFFKEQQYLLVDGRNYYQTLTPAWNSSAQILIRYLNDRSKTEGNLSPLLTSVVDVKYIGRLYNDVAFDSSYTQTAYGDSIYRTAVSNVIDGWTIALMDMRCGDSARIVIPYALAYGSQTVGVISPYSTLVFDVKLVDIPFYEVRP